MQIRAWKELFEPQILLRGQKYCESELVEILSADEHRIEADVEGTDSYSVEITLEDGYVAQMDCTCPYAEDGNNCKHMAAVLFAVEGEADPEASLEEYPDQRRRKDREDRDAALKEKISALSAEQLRAFLTDAAKRHADVRERITLIGKTAVEPAVKKRWSSDIRAIGRRASGRHGFIDYDHASDFGLELSSYLDETIGPLLANSLVMDAFDLVGMVFAEAMGHDIDDSDGVLGSVAYTCRYYWEQLIPAPEADQTKMLDWFKAQIRHYSGEFAEDELLSVVFENFTAPALLPKILALLDEKIRSAGKYALEGLIEQRIVLMERMGASAEDIQAYRMQFWEHPFIRKRMLDQLVQAQDWPQALALLAECERMDAQDRYLLAKYGALRLEILKQSGRTQAWLAALEKFIFTFPQRDLSYISELKKAVPAEAWPPLLEKLLQNENTRALRRELQLSEGMLEQMMVEMEADPYGGDLPRYEKALRKVYPERVRDLFLRRLDGEMQCASSRSAYQRIIQSLKHLYGYPDGRQKAAALAAAWRKSYPRRSALLDELKKAKL